MTTYSMIQVTNENIDENWAQDWSLQNTTQYVMLANKEPLITTKHGFLTICVSAWQQFHEDLNSPFCLWKCHTKPLKNCSEVKTYNIYYSAYSVLLMNREGNSEGNSYVLDKFILVVTHPFAIFGVFTKIYLFIFSLLQKLKLR